MIIKRCFVMLCSHSNNRQYLFISRRFYSANRS